jgi:hypothetical protein
MGASNTWFFYHSVQGERHRNWNGRDLWKEALEYLARSICRAHGLIWIDRTKMVPDLPSPYKPLPIFSPRKRRPTTVWYKDVAARAQQNSYTLASRLQRIEIRGADSLRVFFICAERQSRQRRDSQTHNRRSPGVQLPTFSRRPRKHADLVAQRQVLKLESSARTQDRGQSGKECRERNEHRRRE